MLPRHLGFVLGLILGLVLPVWVPATAAGAPPRGSACALPAPVQRALDHSYAGWQLAAVTPAVRADVGPSSARQCVVGDFDGDGQRDYALQLVLATSRDSAQRVVAYLRRRSGYAAFLLTAYPVQEASYLALGRRGDRIRVWTAHGESLIALRTDAVHVLHGQAAGETCVYARGHFTCETTSD